MSGPAPSDSSADVPALKLLRGGSRRVDAARGRGDALLTAGRVETKT